MRRTVRWIILALAWLALYAYVVASARADEPGDVRGGYFTYRWSSGTFAWEPFLKIAHPKEAASPEGEPEIWGFRPWNLEAADEDGKTPPVNILESRFVPCDGRMHHVTIRHPSESGRQVERRLACPAILWSDGAR